MIINEKNCFLYLFLDSSVKPNFPLPFYISLYIRCHFLVWIVVRHHTITFPHVVIYLVNIYPVVHWNFSVVIL